MEEKSCNQKIHRKNILPIKKEGGGIKRILTVIFPPISFRFTTNPFSFANSHFKLLLRDSIRYSYIPLWSDGSLGHWNGEYRIGNFSESACQGLLQWFPTFFLHDPEHKNFLVRRSWEGGADFFFFFLFFMHQIHLTLSVPALKSAKCKSFI